MFITLQINRIKQEGDESSSALRDRIQKLEMNRLELEEEISHLKNTNMTNKLQHEEQLTIAKQKIQSEEVIC